MKFVNQNFEIRNLVIPIFEQYLESWDTELQQRAVEYIVLCKMEGEVEAVPYMTEIR